MEGSKKPVHTIVLDAGPLIANVPSISTLLKKSEEIFTTPAVVSEIKDATARARLDTLVMPFITLRTPKLESMKFVTEFARKTGDLAVLSKTDLEVIALAYELECERNGGDWRLRRVPGQKTVNGAPPSRIVKEAEATATGSEQNASNNAGTNTESETEAQTQIEDTTAAIERLSIGETAAQPQPTSVAPWASLTSRHVEKLELQDVPPSEASNLEALTKASVLNTEQDQQLPTPPETDNSSDTDEESEGEGWITPSNIAKHKAATASSISKESEQSKTLQVATLTTDHALQNTLLQINLNLLSPSLTRISHIKTHILRCHACFATTRQMEKQFCPRCGQPALTRVTTSTNANGTTSLHLKRNWQWNTRGDRYSIPKPVAGSTNGKMREKGGGKGGWGRDLILAEDQKEYTRAVKDREREKRRNERDYADQDILQSMLSGDRVHAAGGRIQVGAGRNVNAKKRR